MIARKIKSEISGNAVNLNSVHSGKPVVMRAVGVIALVVVDYADRALVCYVNFAVDRYVACRFKEVLFAVQRISEAAVLVFCKRHNSVCKRGYAFKFNVYRKRAALALGVALCRRFSVHKIIGDAVFAVLGFAIAIVVYKLCRDSRLSLGDDVAPAVNFVLRLVVPHEYGKAHSVCVVYRTYQCAFVHIYLKGFPFDKS